MRIRFTKMQGAGNDFIVLDETKHPLNLSAWHYRFLADRRFGIGADQILSVHAAPSPEVDFEYRIHNADGGEVEQCGNGARCFVRFVREQGLTPKSTIRVKTQKTILTLQMLEDGQVKVDMGQPLFDHALVPFDAQALTPIQRGSWEQWNLNLAASHQTADLIQVAVLSMGNPHAVQIVPNIDTAKVAEQGPLIENHARFSHRVNAGFMQIINPKKIRLRVFERGAGETLACGTGACAAVVAGIRLGLLESRVHVETKGGNLAIEWLGGANSVQMTGPATTVFKGEIEIPPHLQTTFS